MNNQTALVLGGDSGLLGQALLYKLQQKGWKTFSINKKDGDILQPNFLQEYIIHYAPDVIFNTIAWTQVDLAETTPEETLTINRTLPALLGTLVKNTSMYLIHFSTDFVFDGTKITPYTENDIPHPLSIYGSSKLEGEKALLNLHLDNYCIIRTAWLFGPGKKNFVETILNLAQKETSLNIIHDQIGSPTYTHDLADAVMHLIQTKAKGLFHIVNTGKASWCELAAEAVHLANLPCTVHGISTNDWGKNIAQRPQYSVLDTTRYQLQTGTSMRPWPQALREYIFTYFLQTENR